jgi:hypothetical protein
MNEDYRLTLLEYACGNGRLNEEFARQLSLADMFENEMTSEGYMRAKETLKDMLQSLALPQAPRNALEAYISNFCRRHHDDVRMEALNQYNGNAY